MLCPRPPACRVHAKHIGHPLLGDDTYGPNPAAAARALAGARAASLAGQLKGAVEALGRPALHALTLGFDHPAEPGRRLEFGSELRGDLVALADALDSILGPRGGGAAM